MNLSDSKLGPQFMAILAQQIQYMLDNSRSKLNDETAAPPNHSNLSQDVKDMKSWHAAAFREVSATDQDFQSEEKAAWIRT